MCCVSPSAGRRRVTILIWCVASAAVGAAYLATGMRLRGSPQVPRMRQVWADAGHPLVRFWTLLDGQGEAERLAARIRGLMDQGMGSEEAVRQVRLTVPGQELPLGDRLYLIKGGASIRLVHHGYRLTRDGRTEWECPLR